MTDADNTPTPDPTPHPPILLNYRAPHRRRRPKNPYLELQIFLIAVGIFAFFVLFMLILMAMASHG